MVVKHDRVIHMIRCEYFREACEPKGIKENDGDTTLGCSDCNFVYYGQTDRALDTRIKEHRRAVRVGDNNSKIAQHANQFGHSIDFDQATIVNKARDYPKRLFLEAWHSLRDRNAGNEHIDVPGIYSSLT